MKLKLIKSGTFLMGSPKDEEGRDEREGPQHKVEITRPFYMGAYPVTKGQFAAFVNENGYSMDSDPVVDVSWNDAVKFCQWLSKKEGRTYELPTEAEWEYAYRAGTTTAFSFPDPKDLGDYAWFTNNSGGHIHPVGGKKANPWGLYDMGGEIWQWCADGYGPYQEEYIKDPKGRDSANDAFSAAADGTGIPPSAGRPTAASTFPTITTPSTVFGSCCGFPPTSSRSRGAT